MTRNILGFTVIEVLIVSSLLMVSMMAMTKISQIGYKQALNAFARNKMSTLQMDLMAVLNDPEMMKQVIRHPANQASTGCLLDGNSVCNVGWQPLKIAIPGIIDGAGTVVNWDDLKFVEDPPSSIRRGFNRHGEECTGYLPGGANPECPFRMVAEWRPICKGVCRDPQSIEIRSRTEGEGALASGVAAANLNKVGSTSVFNKEKPRIKSLTLENSVAVVAYEDGTAKSWGFNGNHSGMLGSNAPLGTVGYKPDWVKDFSGTAKLTGIEKIVDARATLCALVRDSDGIGRVACWGENQDGQAGLGMLSKQHGGPAEEFYLHPQAYVKDTDNVGTLDHVVDIFPGEHAVCAMTEDVSSAQVIDCANEGEFCAFTGRHIVRFGNAGNTMVRYFNDGVNCSVNDFGHDPAPGEQKTCAVMKYDPSKRKIACWGEFANQGAGEVCKPSTQFAGTFKENVSTVYGDPANPQADHFFYTVPAYIDNVDKADVDATYLWDPSRGKGGGRHRSHKGCQKPGNWSKFFYGPQVACFLVPPNNEAMCWGPNWGGELAGTFAGGNGMLMNNEYYIPAVGHYNTKPYKEIGETMAAAGVPRLQNIVEMEVTTSGTVCAIVLNPNGSAFERNVVCWGKRDLWYDAGRQGMMGDGVGGSSKFQEPSYVIAPSGVAGSRLTDIVKISGSKAHFCALNRAGEVFCWGTNLAGQLGNGIAMGTDALYPRKVILPEPATMVETGEQNTCVVTATNRVFCWGAAGYGILGQNPYTGVSRTSSSTTPQEIGGL